MPGPTIILPLFLPNVEISFRGWMGGAIYVENLVTVLSALPEADRPRLLVLTDGGRDAPLPSRLFNLPAVEGLFEPSGTPLAIKPSLAAAVLDSTGKPDAARVTALFGSAAAIFPVLRSMFAPKKALHWIPDFQHKVLPEMFDAEEIRNRDSEFRIMTHSRPFVLVSSEAGRRDLVRYFPTATAKTYVWHFTSRLDPTDQLAQDPRPALGLPPKFLFAPNQFWKHKDHGTLFRAMALLRERGIPAVVACTGAAADARNPTYFAELQTFVAENRLQDAVRFLGVVAPPLLLDLFRHCAAVIQPSRFEGWSTVVEDAKAVGRPLFLTDLPVHREQAEDAVPLMPFHFYPPGDSSGLADSIAAAWADLAPGPDLAAEKAAAARRRIRAEASALAFLAVVRDMQASV